MRRRRELHLKFNRWAHCLLFCKQASSVYTKWAVANRYRSCEATTPVVCWFWQAVESMDSEQRVGVCTKHSALSLCILEQLFCCVAFLFDYPGHVFCQGYLLLTVVTQSLLCKGSFAPVCDRYFTCPRDRVRTYHAICVAKCGLEFCELLLVKITVLFPPLLH